jgi:hypothetical protein
VAEENRAQTAQNPEGYRYAVDCTWTDAPADVLAPMLHALWEELDTEHSFSIWYGWAPRRGRPDMAFSVEADVYAATYAIYTDPADDARYAGWFTARRPRWPCTVPGATWAIPTSADGRTSSSPTTPTGVSPWSAPSATPPAASRRT